MTCQTGAKLAQNWSAPVCSVPPPKGGGSELERSLPPHGKGTQKPEQIKCATRPTKLPRPRMPHRTGYAAYRPRGYGMGAHPRGRRVLPNHPGARVRFPNGGFKFRSASSAPGTCSTSQIRRCTGSGIGRSPRAHFLTVRPLTPSSRSTPAVPVWSRPSRINASRNSSGVIGVLCYIACCRRG
jgi:hypothetical protein